jgi:hypothetical protein
MRAPRPFPELPPWANLRHYAFWLVAEGRLTHDAAYALAAKAAGQDVKPICVDTRAAFEQSRYQQSL